MTQPAAAPSDLMVAIDGDEFDDGMNEIYFASSRQPLTERSAASSNQRPLFNRHSAHHFYTQSLAHYVSQRYHLFVLNAIYLLLFFGAFSQITCISKFTPFFLFTPPEEIHDSRLWSKLLRKFLRLHFAVIFSSRSHVLNFGPEIYLFLTQISK